MKRVVFFVLVLFTILQNGALCQPSATAIIKEVQQRLEKAKMVRVEFAQEFHWTVTDEVQQVTGRLFLGSKDEFRLETPEQTILSDGKTVWTFDQVNHQVIIDNLDRSQDAFLPRQLLARYGSDYEVRVIGKEEVDGSPCFHLNLRPKNRDRYIQELDVWIADGEWITRKVAYVDVNENTTVYRIQKVDFLKQEDKNLFKVSIPEGMEVVDMR